MILIEQIHDNVLLAFYRCIPITIFVSVYRCKHRADYKFIAYIQHCQVTYYKQNLISDIMYYNAHSLSSISKHCSTLLNKTCSLLYTMACHYNAQYHYIYLATETVTPLRSYKVYIMCNKVPLTVSWNRGRELWKDLRVIADDLSTRHLNLHTVGRPVNARPRLIIAAAGREACTEA